MYTQKQISTHGFALGSDLADHAAMDAKHTRQLCIALQFKVQHKFIQQAIWPVFPASLPGDPGMADQSGIISAVRVHF